MCNIHAIKQARWGLSQNDKPYTQHNTKDDICSIYTTTLEMATKLESIREKRACCSIYTTP